MTTEHREQNTAELEQRFQARIDAEEKIEDRKSVV